ncbi:Transposase, partial [Phytophthora megakarya]
RGGRQKDDAWKLVDIDEDNSVWCRRCGQLVHTQGKNHVARVRRHDYEKCGKLPPQAKITDTFKPTLEPTALQAFQESFANWVFSTGVPFYGVEHPSLLKALQLLYSSVKLPSCFQLSTTFLDKAYVRSLTRMEFELGGAMVTIVTDGWTNNNGLAVINYVAVSGKKTYFLESVYTGCQGHDAA